MRGDIERALKTRDQSSSQSKRKKFHYSSDGYAKFTPSQTRRMGRPKSRRLGGESLFFLRDESEGFWTLFLPQGRSIAQPDFFLNK